MDAILLLIGIVLTVLGVKMKALSGQRSGRGISILTFGIVVIIVGTVWFLIGFRDGFSASQAQTQSESDPKAFCEELSQEFRELQSQLPISIDPTTTLWGGNAVYSNGRCSVVFNYGVNFEMVAEIIKKRVAEEFGNSNVPDTQEIIQDLNSEKGRQVFRESMIPVMGEPIHQLARKPFVDVLCNFAFDQKSIQAITINVEALSQ